MQYFSEFTTVMCNTRQEMKQDSGKLTPFKIQRIKAGLERKPASQSWALTYILLYCDKDGLDQVKLNGYKRC